MHVALYRTDTLEMVCSHELEMWGVSYYDAMRNGRFAFSHDSCQLLCTQRSSPSPYAAVGEESICWIWDNLIPYSAASHPRMLTIGYAIHHSTFNPADSLQLFIASRKGIIEVRDVVSGAVLARTPELCNPSDDDDVPLYSPDGRHIVWGASLYDLKTSLLTSIKRYGAAFSPDGTRLLLRNELLKFCQDDSAIGHWQHIAYLVHPYQYAYDSDVYSSFSPDSRFLATGYDDGVVRLWNAEDGACLAIFTEHTAPLSKKSLAFSPNGMILCSGADDGAVHFHCLRGILPD